MAVTFTLAPAHNGVGEIKGAAGTGTTVTVIGVADPGQVPAVGVMVNVTEPLVVGPGALSN